MAEIVQAGSGTVAIARHAVGEPAEKLVNSVLGDWPAVKANE